MPKRSSKPTDAPVRSVNTTAEAETLQVVPAVTDEDPMTSRRITKQPKKKNPAAVALGRLGGLKGGIARAKKLTAKKRAEIAKKAAETRWKR